MSGMICIGLVAGMLGAPALPGMWASDNLTKVLQTDLPPADAPPELRLSGARGEVASGQAAVRLDTSAAATATISDLQLAGGDAEIPARYVSLQWVRYIAVERNSGSIPDDELVAKAPISLPDPFWEGPEVDIEAGRTQPLWIEVTIPENTPPGDYGGTLHVSAGEQTLDLPVTLRVWNFDMPHERHLSVINWWTFPGTGFGHIAPFTDEYWELLDSACRFVVAHRQTEVWASLTQLVDDTGDEASGYVQDTSRLERWAETAFGAGVSRIHFQPVGGTSAHIVDPSSTVLPVGDAMLRRLAAVDRLIAEKGWQDRFMTGITDEPFVHHEDSFRDAVAQVHAAAPGIRVIEAVESVHLGLDVYVPKLNHLHLWQPEFERIRQETGAELWFYTCCIPAGRYPNRFLDQSLLKARVLHWINYRYQLDGFLHWGLNQFAGDDPYSEEGVSKGLPLGDRAVAYPGYNGFLGSLRFSAQRDGLQDFEYLWLLEQRLGELKARIADDAHWLDPAQRPMELCRRVVDSFTEYTRDNAVLTDTRRQIAEEIEALGSDRFLVVQTTPHEGFPVPVAAPTNTIIRGIAPPGAEVQINGEPVANVKPNGVFNAYAFGVGEAIQEITVTASTGDWEQTVTRAFPKTEP